MTLATLVKLMIALEIDLESPIPDPSHLDAAMEATLAPPPFDSTSFENPCAVVFTRGPERYAETVSAFETCVFSAGDAFATIDLIHNEAG